VWGAGLLEGDPVRKRVKSEDVLLTTKGRRLTIVCTGHATVDRNMKMYYSK
jgi:hypothetical protein